MKERRHAENAAHSFIMYETDLGLYTAFELEEYASAHLWEDSDLANAVRLKNFAVEPEYRGNGFGSMLFSGLCAVVKSKGYEYLTAHAANERTAQCFASFADEDLTFAYNNPTTNEWEPLHTDLEGVVDMLTAYRNVAMPEGSHPTEQLPISIYIQAKL